MYILYIYISYIYIVYEYVILKKITNQIFKIQKIKLVNNDKIT